MSIKELAQAATSLAQSNERMANNFIDYAQSNARRIRVVVAALVVVIIGIGGLLYGLKIIRDSQSTNTEVIQAIHNATDPNSTTAKASTARTVLEIDHAVACVNNHTDRALATLFAKPVPPVLAGCPS